MEYKLNNGITIIDQRSLFSNVQVIGGDLRYASLHWGWDCFHITTLGTKITNATQYIEDLRILQEAMNEANSLLKIKP